MELFGSKIPTVHVGVAATQMERKGIATERGNQNRKISRLNQILFAIKAKLKQFKDLLKSAVTPDARNERTRKPSVMAQIENFKKEIKESEKAESATLSTLADLHIRFDDSYKKLKRIDMRLKNANGATEYDRILPERHKAYAEYSALKSEVKKAEKNLPQKKARLSDQGR